jgi:surface carbohydrate biosynthesis protein
MVNISRLKSKLKLLYTIFIAPPKEWQLPKKGEVLIYDACGAEAISPYLTKYSFTTMTVRGEAINVPCLLRAAATLKFWKGKPLNAYAEKIIQAVSPKVVITFIDNNPAFYGFSKLFPEVKTILLQNGSRYNWLDGNPGKHEYHVDYMLVFGASIGKYYNAHISGEVVPVGSLKNNAVSNTNGVKSDGVLFISQYRDKPKNNSPFYTDSNGEPVYHKQFYSAEVVALRFLAKWCVENKKSLKIASMSPGKTGPEFDFFEAILSGCSWEYIPKIGLNSSYKLVDAAEIVVGIDSTLVYESIGRGKKTASFFCRGINLNNESRTFGWPAELPKNGPFWTNDQDETQFQRIMDYLNTVSDEDWEQTRQHYATELMEYDPGNTRFVELLDQLLPRTDSQSNPIKSHAN